VPLTNVVTRGLPFQLTTDAEVKPVPLTVSEKAPLVAIADDGESDVTVGTGGGTKITFTAGLVAARV